MPATPNRKTKIRSNRIADDSRGSACTTRGNVGSPFSDAAAYFAIAVLWRKCKKHVPFVQASK